VPEALAEAVRWSVTAALDAIFAIAFGLILIPIGTHIVGPVWGKVFGGRS
jgi:hypothetical protein